MQKNGTREMPFLPTVAVISLSRCGPSRSAVGVEVLLAANRFTAGESQHLPVPHHSNLLTISGSHFWINECMLHGMEQL